MFAKSLPMIYVKALKRLHMLRTQPELKNKLWENVNALQNGLKKTDLISKTHHLVLLLFISTERFQRLWPW